MMRDLRDAIRGVRQRPSFTALAVLTLALGIAVNGAVIAIAYGILVRPLPYASPDRIVVLNLLFRDGGDLGVSPSDTDEWLRRLGGVEAGAAYFTRDVTVRSGSRSVVVRGAFVTDGFFDVFGVAAERGQARVTMAPPTVSIARRRVADVLRTGVGQAPGTSVTISDRAHTIGSAMPASFGFPDDQTDMWLPIQMSAEGGYTRIVARLRPGVTLEQFRQDAERVRREMHSGDDAVVAVSPLGESITAGLRRLLVAAVAGSLLVLIVACANIATLFIGRDIGRRREFATRLALGATRADLVRRVLAEALVLSSIAAVAGFALAAAVLKSFTSAASGELPMSLVAIDLPVAACVAVLTFAAALLIGMVPAWHAACGDFAAFLKPTSASHPGAWMARRVLVFAQIACSCVLLVGAGLLVRTVTVLLHEDSGFDANHAAVAKLVLSDRVLSDAGRAPMLRTLLDRTRGLPDVRTAGFGSSLPPRPSAVTMSLDLETGGVRQSRMMKIGSVTPGFLPALGARLLAGRDFQDADGNAAVVVLSASLARFYFGDRDPIGRTFVRLPKMFGLSGAPRVIGVVSDIKYDGLDAPAASALYLPWTSLPFGTGYLVVRTGSDPRRVLPDIRRTIAALDSQVAVPELSSLDDLMSRSIAGRRVRAIPAAGFGLLALAVAGVGMVATLSMLVAERRRDLAIRAALGASRERLLWTVGREGLILTVLGLAGGLGTAALVARTLSTLLYGVRPYDAIAFGGTAVLVLATSLLMTGVAAIRTLAIVPAAVLRQE